MKTDISPESLTLLWDQRILLRRIRETGVNVFFSPYGKAPITCPVPTVVTIHDLGFMPSERGTPSSWARSLVRRKMVQRAARIVTVSDFSKKEIVAEWGLSADKIRVIYNGVSDRFVPDPSSEKKDPYILYVGNFLPHKNVACLVEAYAQLPESRRMSVRLVLAGKESVHRTTLMSKVKELGLAERVRFAGSVADEDLPALYQGSELFVFPSLYEGFGLPPLEAMACGTPVISSNAASLPEVVGDAGLLVDPTRPEDLTRAIECLLSDDAARRLQSEKGLRQAAKFSSETAAKALLDTITGLG